jgi:serine acetyltransferase
MTDCSSQDIQFRRPLWTQVELVFENLIYEGSYIFLCYVICHCNYHQRRAFLGLLFNQMARLSVSLDLNGQSGHESGMIGSFFCFIVDQNKPLVSGG